MTALTWDETGQRTYETGVDHGVLYLPNASGAYVDGVAWNGLTTVTESPSGAEANPQYADNIKYLNLFSAEDFGATLEAFTYPDEFAEFDGLAVPTPGLALGQQARKTFGLSYRTKLGNDIDGDDYGYKLHLIYGCSASPSEKAYNTINDSPEAITFSWEVSTVPVPVTGYKPTALIVIDSTKVDPTNLAALETLLYGTTGVDPALPQPDAVIATLTSGITNITSLTTPTAVGNVVTITEDTGVLWYANGMLITLDGDGSTDYTITEDTLISAAPAAGYAFSGVFDTDWGFEYT